MGILDLFGKAKEIGDGVQSITDGIGRNTSRIISTIKDKVPPEMRGEIAKLELELGAETARFQKEAEVEIKKLLAKSEESFRDFVLKYEGSAEQVPPWIVVLRSLIRPTITIFMFAILMLFMGSDVYSVYTAGDEAKLIMTELPQAYWVILGIVLGFWFGGKAGENIADKIKKK